MTELFHGTWWELHKKKTYDELKVGRYIRMFPEGPEFNGTDLQRLAEKMTSTQERRPTPEDERDPEEDPEITAAYTYLGQFTDHDLTFDPLPGCGKP